MIPVGFADMLGYYHPSTGRLGALIVRPLGLEALASTQALRHLAESLADRGISTLTLDLPGTGNAPGEVPTPDPIAVWSSCIARAANRLRALSGATSIGIVGLRLGASLACAAAQQVEGLGGLVLIHPVVTGKPHIRELAMTARAVAEASGLDPDATRMPEGLSLGGFLYPQDLLESVQRLDLRSLAPSAPTLVLAREGTRDAVALVQGWSEAGADVRLETPSGVEQILANPTLAQTPILAWRRIGDWLAALPVRAGEGTPSPVAIVAGSTLFEGPNYCEEAVVFGPDSRLFGMLCQPSGVSHETPLVLRLNAGRNPAVGWARSGVDDARALARLGIATFRFDLSGIGESGERIKGRGDLDDVLYRIETVVDVRAALDAMAARGFRTMGVWGACSGGLVAFLSAVEDDRIKGAIIVNPYRFGLYEGDTASGILQSAFRPTSHYVANALNPQAWRRFITGGGNPLRLGMALVRRLASPLTGRFPDAVARSARKAVRRIGLAGLRLDIVFTDDDLGLFERDRIFGREGRWLRAHGHVHQHSIGRSDHDMTPVQARAAMRGLVAAAVRQWGFKASEPTREGRSP